MLWAVNLCDLSEHLTNASMTQIYNNAGTIGNTTPQMRWNHDQAASVVKQLIAASVPDTVFNRIKTGTTAKDVWDALKKLYEGHMMLILIDLGRRLQTMHCGEEDNVCEHFEQLAEMHKQLTAMGKSVLDNEFVSILMGLLLSSYAPTLSGIAAAAEISTMTPTEATVTKLALDEYDRHTLGNDKSQDQAFAVDARKKGKKCDVECFNCHKRGHMRADCWAKGGGKEGQGPKKNQSSKEGGKKTDAAAGAEQKEEKGKEKKRRRTMRLRHGLQSRRWRWRSSPLRSQQQWLMKPEVERQNSMILGHLVICPRSVSDSPRTVIFLLALSLQLTTVSSTQSAWEILRLMC
jgi:hypothetical protein